MSLIGAATFLTMLCLPFFIHYPMNDNYLQLYPISLGIGVVSVVACIFSFVKGNGFRFCLPDYLFLALVAYYIMRYDYTLQLANWKVAFALLSVPLWFGSRIILSHRSVSRQWILCSIVAVGCMVAVWGLLQLYGYLPSNHNLFAITGPFYNPGPYSGYIAIIFCIALGCWLQSKGFARYIWFAAIALMGCILPAGMSRSAWVGIFASSLWMLTLHFQWHKRLKSFFKQHPYKGISAVVVLGISLCIGSYLIFQMKSDSAYGRLFIWKNTCTAISDAPLFGHGPGSFPMVYGKAQAEYFAKGDYTETEERVAGSPEYAFNEYLQFAIEGGIILFIGTIIFGICIFHNALKQKEYRCLGALFAFAFFAFSSYPLQVLSIGIMIITVSAICVPQSRLYTTPLYRCVCRIAIGASFILLMFIIKRLPNTSKVNELWNNAYALYGCKDYRLSSQIYEEIYPQLCHHPFFVKNYGCSLFHEGRYREALEIFKRATLISCEAEVYNWKGRCYQEMKDYESAERSYQYALNLIPHRIYPYYMLAKLYAEPDFYNEEKSKEMITVVLNKPPKVHSKAIDEMRNDVNSLLNDINKFN